MSADHLKALLSKQELFPILGENSKNYRYLSLDLSTENEDLSKVDVSSSNALEGYIWSQLKAKQAHAAYGGYLERRGIYNRSTYFNQSDPKTERNIHLGIDIWIEAETPIYLPLQGELHSFKNNTNFGDYGPTIVVKHTIEGFEFYTLYGHLSLESLKDKRVGETLAKGQEIGTLGAADVNGDYPPHLHFQVILDLQGFKGDYPGVSNTMDLEFYKANCPNPIYLAPFLKE
ncbi:peptidoglycan DD-metalloendopeptidase family protein [uncultured Winogradskyella sp.]|uniref:peptidoglycan DD-metalloendopeptidase family protein n=1 Tax=uncultured Winogradskyella sp. TaxID=395353 RepID=UPI003516B8A5